MVQAMFLHAMEVNEGVICLEETNLETVAVVMALEDKLGLEMAKRVGNISTKTQK